MQFVLETDSFGRLIGTLSDGRAEAKITSSEKSEALRDLAAAIDAVERDGRGECFWEEGGGVYRWMFARNGENVRVAVLWSIGTLTGWEHVYWAEHPFAEVASMLRGEIERLGPVATT